MPFSATKILKPTGGRFVLWKDDDRVLEVHRAPLGIGEPSIIQDLQEDVEDVGVRLLYLVQEQDAVVTAPDSLSELACLLIADVAGRGPNQAAHRVALLELAHVYAHPRRLLPEEGFGQSAGELCRRLSPPSLEGSQPVLPLLNPAL